jgi:hypothetical protein
MAGLFFMFIVTITVGEMLGDYLKAQDEADDSDGFLKITFTPDDASFDWEEARKK